jgi:hypothetical protein
MSRPILRLLCWCVPLACLLVAPAHARTATARIDRVTSAVATMDDVRVQLHWPAQAAHGELRLQARRAVAPALGYHFEQLDWRCPLQRDGATWRCAGELRAGGERLQLSIVLGSVATTATLQRGGSRIHLDRDAATPDLTRIDLTRVPLVWAQALLSQAWETGRITGGTLDGSLAITAPDDAPLRVAGPLALEAAAFDTPDGTVAGENIGARVEVEAELGQHDRFAVDGHLHGGELLFGTTYVSLQERAVAIGVEARQAGDGWTLPRIAWNDPGILEAQGHAALGSDAALRRLDLRLDAPALSPLAADYLSGWLGIAGLGDMALHGAADARVRLDAGGLEQAELQLQDVDLVDARGRFAFDRIDGDLRFSSGAPVASRLDWQGGALYDLAFGPSRLSFRSAAGVLRLAEPVELPMLGGSASVDHLQLRPPSAGQPMDLRFGLSLDGLDVARLSAALDWPAFTGQLSGSIPEARYSGDRLELDGGLAMQLFGGEVSVTALSMERPFGVLPTLTADIDFDDIDLMALTGAFDFGSISGKLDGRIAGLRLVDWQPVAFDAQLRTDRQRGVRQRISQRAVQDLSSVGNSSFVGSLQAQLIGFFDDFGYSQLGIGCRLADEVCMMDGLGSVGEGFIIVRGSGLPRLDVVGFNRRVDWPMLVERLAAVGSGDVKPVVD